MLEKSNKCSNAVSYSAPVSKTDQIKKHIIHDMFFNLWYNVSMKIYFATDHAGFELRNTLIDFVRGLGYEVEDLGTKELDLDDDYTDFIALAAEKISQNPTDKAIILGGSGQGEAMLANRFPNVRATVCYGGDDLLAEKIITLSREHNDANILSFGARFISSDQAKHLTQLWLETSLSDDSKYLRRIQKAESIK